MKFILTAVIVIGLGLGAWQIYQYVGNSPEPSTAATAPPAISGDELAGLPEKLRPVLDAARQRGVAGLRDFLDKYSKTVQDPRLAWIQLDYVLLVNESDHAEARRIFAKVKDRVPANSPVYPRVQQLEKTYD